MNTDHNFKPGERVGCYKLMSGPSEYLKARVLRVRDRVIDVEAENGRQFTFSRKTLLQRASTDKNNPRRLLLAETFDERVQRLKARRQRARQRST